MNRSGTRAQRAMARDRAYANQRRREQWIAGLAPEHRAIHERPSMAFCSFCVNDGLTGASDGIRAAMAALSSVSARRMRP